MNNEKNFSPDSDSNEDEEFKKFLELVKSGMGAGMFQEEEEESDFPEFPDESEDEMCPAMSAIVDLVRTSIDNLGFLGLRWSEEDMLEILKALGYKKSTYTVTFDYSDDVDQEELDFMKAVIPEGKLDIPIVKKGRTKITEDNFRDHKIKEVFNREMGSLGKSLILDLIKRYGDTSGDSR